MLPIEPGSGTGYGLRDLTPTQALRTREDDLDLDTPEVQALLAGRDDPPETPMTILPFVSPPTHPGLSSQHLRTRARLLMRLRNVRREVERGESDPTLPARCAEVLDDVRAFAAYLAQETHGRTPSRPITAFAAAWHDLATHPANTDLAAEVARMLRQLTLCPLDHHRP